MRRPILSIAIPTYNRADLLEHCLKSIFSQINESISAEVQVIVSNNASTDETRSIVSKYSGLNNQIDYFENSKNLGPDLNIAQCFEKSKGKYVWILGDDDFILPGRLIQIIEILKNGEYGVIYMQSLWYRQENEIAYKEEKINYKTYTESLEFLKQIHYWITFISGNIINKAIINNKASIYQFEKTNLIQLGWAFPAIFSTNPNIIVQSPIVACKADNTGGYKLIQVFGKNFNKILNHFIRQGYDRRIRDIINNNLLISFFPIFLSQNNKGFKNETYYFSLISLYWKYPIFWRTLFQKLIKKLFSY